MNSMYFHARPPTFLNGWLVSVLCASLGAALCNSANAETSVHLMVDTRGQVSNAGEQEFDRHVLKLGEANDRDESAVLTLGIAPSWEGEEWLLRLSALGDTLADGDVAVSELFLAYRPTPESAWASQLKTGFFFAPFTLENTQRFWQNAVGLTASANDSWFGEELRTYGSEYALDYRGQVDDNPWSFGFSASVFQGNDPAGSLLAWRGFALHSRISRYNEAVDLSALPAFADNAAFPEQASTVHPFKEIDHRAGWYGGLRAAYARTSQLAYWHYDNRGEPTVLNDGQYAWHTRFNLWSLRQRLSDDWEVLAQQMSGTTLMGAGLTRVELAFDSAYVLLSKSFEQHLLSLRVDHFNIDDHDQTLLDDNSERGHAVTLAWLLDVDEHWRIGAEGLRISSERVARAYVGLEQQSDVSQFTLSLRYSY